MKRTDVVCVLFTVAECSTHLNSHARVASSRALESSSYRGIDVAAYVLIARETSKGASLHLLGRAVGWWAGSMKDRDNILLGDIRGSKGKGLRGK
jgi:hypothetical protein